MCLSIPGRLTSPIYSTFISFVLILRRNFRLVLAASQSVPGTVTAIVLMIAFGEELISLQISSTHQQGVDCFQVFKSCSNFIND